MPTPTNCCSPSSQSLDDLFAPPTTPVLGIVEFTDDGQTEFTDDGQEEFVD